MLRSKCNTLSLALFAMAAAPLSAFAAVDTTDITAAKTDILAVGLAVFGVYVALKLYKWVRRAL